LVFCLFICRHKVSFIGGDTALLGRLAKAGCFGKVGNICDAFGRKCVLSGNKGMTIEVGGKTSVSSEISVYFAAFFTSVHSPTH